MADYNSSNTDVKVFIHDPKPGSKSETSAVGTYGKRCLRLHRLV